MSNSVYPLKTVQVKDPICRIDSERYYAILKGGNRVSYKQYTTNTFSNSSLQYTTPPPSPQVIVDRKVLIKLPVKINFVGTSQPGMNLLQTGFDSFRENPISSIINTASSTINNASNSINLHDVIDGLSRYNYDREIKAYNDTVATDYLDEYQHYEDAAGSNRNPLGGYGDNSTFVGRGAFPIEVISNTDTEAEINATLYEYIKLSPYLWSKLEQSGFYGIQDMSWNFTLIGNLSYIWSHSNASGSTLTSVNVTIGAGAARPALLFKYITPDQLDKPSLSKPFVYPFYDVQRYVTDLSSFVAGETRRVESTNIQLKSIPHRIYMWLRRPNSVQTFETTNSFFRINNISVNWENDSGLLASADSAQLYEMSVKNGLKCSWNEWYGYTPNLAGQDNDQIALTGSVLCLQPGLDIGLGPLEAPSSLGTYQLQISVDTTNISKDVIAPSLYIVVVSEGTLTIHENRTIQNIGVVSQQDVLNLKDVPEMNYYDVMGYDGGDFLSSLKHGLSKIWGFIKKVAPVIAPPLIKAFMGAGDDMDDMDDFDDYGSALTGGEVVNPIQNRLGGRMLSRRELRDRLM